MKDLLPLKIRLSVTNRIPTFQSVWFFILNRLEGGETIQEWDISVQRQNNVGMKTGRWWKCYWRGERKGLRGWCSQWILCALLYVTWDGGRTWCLEETDQSAKVPLLHVSRLIKVGVGSPALIVTFKLLQNEGFNKTVTELPGISCEHTKWWSTNSPQKDEQTSF